VKIMRGRAIRRRDDVLSRTSLRLDDGGGSPGLRFESIGKERRRRRRRRSLEWQHTFPWRRSARRRRGSSGLRPRRWSAVRARRRWPFDLTCLTTFQAKSRALSSVFGRRAVAGHFQIGDGQAEAGRHPEEEGRRNLAEDAGVVSGPDDGRGAGSSSIRND